MLKKRAKKVLLTAAASLVCTGLSMTALAADKLDLNSAEGFIKAQRKIQCSLKDGEETTFVWRGKAYSRVPGEKDRHLFDLLGMNVRACQTLNDPKQGVGYRHVSREIMLYLDPQTGEVMRRWNNPWTQETVNVVQVANDPVNGHPVYGKTKDGKSLAFKPFILGDTWQMPHEFPLFYPNPLGGQYQKYVGGTYHAAEIFDFSGNLAELLNADISIAYPQVAWVRIAGWLPWMEMGDRAGLMYFNAMGGKLNSWNDLPEVMKSEIKRSFPEYRHAPPLDDQRPNETSWTYFKKQVDKK